MTTCIALSSIFVCQPICSLQVVKSKYKYLYAKSQGLSQAKPEPSWQWWLWPGLSFDKAKAASSQAKAGAFRPSWAMHSPTFETNEFIYFLHTCHSPENHSSHYDILNCCSQTVKKLGCFILEQFFFSIHDFWYCSSSVHLSACNYSIKNNCFLNFIPAPHTQSLLSSYLLIHSLDSSSQLIFLASYSLPIIS